MKITKLAGSNFRTLEGKFNIPLNGETINLFYADNTGKVTFMGCDIWTVDTDTREYNEETDTYEAYEDCFRREAISVIGNLDAVKQILNQGT